MIIRYWLLLTCFLCGFIAYMPLCVVGNGKASTVVELYDVEVRVDVIDLERSKG